MRILDEMPRYFFHLTHETTVLDPEGEMCPTVEHAKELATRTARDLARNKGPSELNDLAICVTDESGREVFRVPLITPQ